MILNYLDPKEVILEEKDSNSGESNYELRIDSVKNDDQVEAA